MFRSVMVRSQPAAGILLLVAGLVFPKPAAADPDRAAFFESKIRPLLVAHCLDCHSGAEAEGGLNLESRAGWQRGGDSGPAIAVDTEGRGSSAESLLYKAVTYADRRIKMPPDGRLSQREIDDLKTWIDGGAFDPRVEAAAPARQDPASRYDELLASHWAYLPRRPDVPGTTIDRLVDRGLHDAGLEAAAEAGPETLVRRLHVDLTGLPPGPEELAADARLVEQGGYGQVVDRLLASPRHAEHFARHWLDVARYAESLTLRGFLIPQAWRYRDYVVDAFASDMPFDRFVREQIAGDLLAAGTPDDERRQRIASSFLALGNHNREEQDKKQLDLDVVDEQLTTIGLAFLGQTIGCARCHDHKFDPLSTREYYALAGILGSATLFNHGNVSEPRQPPLPLVGDEIATYAALETELATITAEVDELSRLAKQAGGVSVASTIPLSAVNGVVVDDAAAARVGVWRASVHAAPSIGDGYLHDEAAGRGSKTLTFTPSFAKAGRYDVYLAYQPGPNRASNAGVSLLHADGEFSASVDQREKPAVAGILHLVGTFRFEEGDQHYLILSNEDADGHVIGDAVVFVEAGTPPLRTQEADGDEAQALAKRLEERRRAQKRKQAELATRPRYPGLEPTAAPRDFPIHVRGNPHVTAAVVPRGLPRLGTPPGGGRPAIPPNESGRRQLAEWIAAADNPLTARVMANRVWLWLLGAGIVRTPDNFGTTGEPPTHPELLDHLAGRLIANGWSVRSLVREIVLSRTYRRSSRPSSEARRVDPDNRLWSHALRRRLAAEQLRDAVLAASGRLSFERPPQPTVSNDFGYVHEAACRSLYVPAFRNSSPDLFTVFDAADAGSPVGQRNTSIIPTQGLYLLNSAFITREAEAVGGRFAAAGERSLTEGVVELYRRLLGRSPRPDELEFALGHLAEQPDARDWAILAHALFASPDFRYLD
jgi:hypothetical protein